LPGNAAVLQNKFRSPRRRRFGLFAAEKPLFFIWAVGGFVNLKEKMRKIVI